MTQESKADHAEQRVFPTRQHIERAAARHGKPFKCGPVYVDREVLLGTVVRTDVKVVRGSNGAA